MSRPLRIIYSHAWYHVMNRGAAKKNIFHSDVDRVTFLNLLNKIHERYHIEIHAYCLMDNHYHLLVRTPLENLSQAIKYLNGTYAQKFNANKKIDGPLFRGRFKSKVVDEDEYLIYLTRYIHLNPVKAGICLNPWDYVWSSCKAYLGISKVAWLSTNEILKMLYSTTKFLNYASLLGDTEDDVIKEKLLASSPIFGTKKYIKKIVETHLLQNECNTEIPEDKNARNTQLPTFEHIYQKTIYATNKYDYLSHINPRNIAIYLGVSVCQQTLAQIASKFSIKRSRISKIYHDIDMLIKNDGELKSFIDKIIATLWKVEM